MGKIKKELIVGTKEWHFQNFIEKIYEVRCNIPMYNDGTKYYGFGYYKSYRTAKQALNAIRDFRKQNITSSGRPWKWKIEIFCR